MYTCIIFIYTHLYIIDVSSLSSTCSYTFYFVVQLSDNSCCQLLCAMLQNHSIMKTVTSTEVDLLGLAKYDPNCCGDYKISDQLLSVLLICAWPVYV